MLKLFRNVFDKQCRPRSDCLPGSGSTMFASMHTLVNNVTKYMQQTTEADDISASDADFLLVL